MTTPAKRGYEEGYKDGLHWYDGESVFSHYETKDEIPDDGWAESTVQAIGLEESEEISGETRFTRKWETFWSAYDRGARDGVREVFRADGGVRAAREYRSR